MIIKDAEYEDVMVKQRMCVSAAVHGCDECKAAIDIENGLEMTVFRSTKENTESLQFCSWDCVLAHIPKVKTDYFVKLPFVHFDADEESKCGSSQLIKLLTMRNTQAD